MSRSRRRPRRGPRFLFTLIIVGLLVFLGADNLGFDWFKDFQIDLSNSSSTTDSTTSKANREANKAPMSGYANIVIKDDTITYNESTVTMKELATALDKLDKKTMTINLMDNVAYNNTFTDVETLLKDKGMKYTVSTLKTDNK